MGKRERYELGTFCWMDLATTDPAGARAFYGELFGWETEDVLAGRITVVRDPQGAAEHSPASRAASSS